MHGTYDARELVDSVEGFRALALANRLHVRYRSEFPRHADNRGIGARYFSARGISPDDLGELWYDGGLLDSRPSEREVIDRLDAIFERATRHTGQHSETAEYRALEAQREKIRKNRNFPWKCECGAIAFYAAAGALSALHALTASTPCPDCGHRITRRQQTLAEFDAGIPLSVIQATDYNPLRARNGLTSGDVDASAPVPF
jgi:hypothetical protein